MPDLTRRRLAAVVVLSLAAAHPATGQSTDLRATIRFTSYGVPHVKADDLAGAGFGLGYAYASQDICTVADRWVTLRAERSRFFGIEGRRDARQPVTNYQSDVYWQWIIDQDLVGTALKQAPPVGPSPETRELVRGYVAGYNHYLALTGVARLPDRRCRGQAWVRPITDRDVYLRALHTSVLTGSRWIGAMTDAIAPGATGNPAGLGGVDQPAPDRLTMSNVVALGRDATDNGKGMVFINPHWRWHEPERFYEAHLTVPGVLDVYGGTWPGSPAILLGFNRNVAWSHTASVPKRETIYQLRLVPGQPTRYQYQGESRAMTSRQITVTVREPDGRLVPRRHTIWETHFGPIVATNNFVWSDSLAYAVRLSTMSFRWLSQEVAMNMAKTVEEFDQAGRTYLGLGWLNSVAADDRGHVIYGDRSAVPHVTNAMRQACTTTDFAKQQWTQQQLVVLDGWRADCEWGTDPDAPVPGIFGPKRLPMLDRWDYATNSNDSHWTNNATQLLEGFDAVIGDEKTQRSLRTRNGLAKITRRLAGTDGYPGTKFTLDQFEAITMNNRVYSAELWRDPLVSYCRTLPVQHGVPEACEVLARWDLTDNLDSEGAVLWRRFMENLTPAAQPDPDFFTTPLDPKDPANTPRGLNTANPRVYRALASAIGDLRNNAMPLNARLRDYQVEERAGKRIPIPGGPAPTGQYNLIAQTESGWVPGKGWRNIMHASSYIGWVQYTDKGPVARSVNASGQSDNPDSPHHADQTLLFSAGKSKPALFDDQAIQADPHLRTMTICLSARGRPCGRR